MTAFFINLSHFLIKTFGIVFENFEYQTIKNTIMKKFILSLIITISGIVGLNAQSGTFEVGPYLGAPIGDADGYNFNTGATFAYYFNVIPKLKVGPLIGVDQFFGKEENGWDYPDVTFLPLAASAKFNFTERFYAGLDLGYAIGLSDGAGDGGLLARPQIGISLPIVDLYGYYKSINFSVDEPGDWDSPGDWDDDWNLGSIGVGAAFKF